jgi:hypothetical protein
MIERHRLVAIAAIACAAVSIGRAQSSSAVLSVTATVVPSCRVDVPRQADPSEMSTLPVSLACGRGVGPRIQRPQLGPQTDGDDSAVVVDDAVLVIDF